MKKTICAVLLVLLASVTLFALDSDETGLDWNMRAGLSFPVIPYGPFFETIAKIGGDNAAKMGYTLATIALSSIAAGGGVQYTIIPHLLVPGIYADLHFNLVSWGLVYLITEKDLVLLQGGLRLYNQFSLGNYSIEPFFGCNFAFIEMNDDLVTVPLLAVGFTGNIKKIGIEYGYNFFPKKELSIGKLPPLSAIHRITVWYKLFPIR